MEFRLLCQIVCSSIMPFLLPANGQAAESSTAPWLYGPAGAAILGALVGGIIGAGSGLLNQLFLAWRERRHLRRNILIALKVEIEILVGVLEYSWQLRDRASQEENPVIGAWFLIPRTNLQQLHFQAYPAAVAHLSLLPADVVQDVVRFYASIAALEEFAKYSTDPNRRFSRDYEDFLVSEAKRRYEMTFDQGRSALQRLRSSR